MTYDLTHPAPGGPGALLASRRRGHFWPSRRYAGAFGLAGLLTLLGGLACSTAPSGSLDIQSFSAATSTVAPGGSTQLTAEFPSGTGTLDHGLGAMLSGVPVATGKLTESTTFTLTVRSRAGVTTATTTVTVQALTPVITAPIAAPADTPDLIASVPEQAGCSYTWTVSGGVITAGQGSRQITFSSGSAGTLNLSCVATPAAGTPSPAGTAALTVAGPALTPVISAPASATANTAGLSASVPDQAGCSFAWTATGGTITAGQGTRQITFTAGGAGTVTLRCVATPVAGNPSAAGTASVAVHDPVSTPVITVVSSAPAFTQGLIASVPDQAGCSFAWTLSGGTLSAGQGTRQITFNAGAAGNLTLSCVATLASGVAAPAGSATLVVTEITPVINEFSANPKTFYAGLGSTLKASFIGGTGVITPGDIPVSDGQSVTVKPSANVTYTLTVTNGLGVASSATLDLQVNPVPYVPRSMHTATRLQDGRVLIVGGMSISGDSLNVTDSASIYDPANGLALPTGSLHAPRMAHSATLLPSGKVLIVGGYGSMARASVAGVNPVSPSLELNTAELYDPATDTFTLCKGQLAESRLLAAASLVPGGVLITGGMDLNGGAPNKVTAEWYDLDSDTFSTLGAVMTFPRAGHSQTVLADGQVLLAGGYLHDMDSSALPSAELFDPVRRTFAALPAAMNVGRSEHSATLLASGQVLLVGGTSAQKPGIPGYLAECYDPVLRTFAAVGRTNSIRFGHTATLLADGNVLIAGGQSLSSKMKLKALGAGQASSMAVSAASPFAEIFAAAEGKFRMGSLLQAVRTYHSATLLDQGKVLLAGGLERKASVGAELEIYDTQNPGPAAVIPAPELSTPNPVVAGQPFQATVGNPMAGYTYAWTISNGSASNPTATASVFPYIAGSLGSLTLTCTATSPAGIATATASLTVDVVAVAPVPVISSFTATPATIRAGESVQLDWSVTGADDLQLLPSAIPVPLSGAVIRFSPSVTTTYTLVANHRSYHTSSQAQVTVTVLHPPAEPVINVASALTEHTPLQGANTFDQPGATFTWSISDGVILGSNGTDSPLITFAVNGPGSVTLTCTARNAAGATSSSRIIDVVAMPQAVLKAEPAFYLPGQACKLTATFTGIRANITGIGPVLNGESVVVHPGANGASYSMVATNQAGKEAVTSVHVGPAGLAEIRYRPLAITLPSGKILFLNGYDTSGGDSRATSIYDPVTGGTERVGMAAMTRFGASATLLPDGRVLNAGGQPITGGTLNTAELFDPVSNQFLPTPIVQAWERSGHTATLLPNGQVLLVGGYNLAQYSAELFDPVQNTFEKLGLLATPRIAQSAVLLDSGKVLVVGGLNDGGALASAELYDPATRAFTPVPGTLNQARYLFSATLLGNGKVLIAGGLDGSGSELSSIEQFDPATGQFTVLAGNGGPAHLAQARSNHFATRLPSGKVLFVGGSNVTSGPYLEEILDPETGALSDNGVQLNIENNCAVLLASGQVLLAGGFRGSTPSVPMPANTKAGNRLFLVASAPEPAPGFPSFLFPCKVQCLTAGQPATIAPCTAESGLTWSVSPDLTGTGLTCDPATGVISGTAQACASARYRVTASNGTNQSSADLWITVK